MSLPSVSTPSGERRRPEVVPSLSPWGSPPPSHLLALAPLDFWSQHQVLPLREESRGGNDLLLVASAQAALSPRAHQELERQCGRLVQVIPAPADEVCFWLEVLSGERTWPEAFADAVAAALVSLGLVDDRVGAAAARVHLGGDNLGVAQVQAAFGLAEDVAVEVLALQAHLPHVRLERYRPPVQLAALLSRDTATPLAVAPLAARRGVVVLASPLVHGSKARARLEHEIGMSLRLCLCAPTAFERWLASLYSSAEPAPPRVDEAALLAHLSRTGVLDATHREGLATLARVTGESPLSAARRLGYLSIASLVRGQADLLGVSYLPGEHLQVDAAQARLASPALWRRWGCVPARHAGSGVLLAAVSPLAPTTVRAVEALVGTTVRPALTAEEGLQAALRALPAPRAERYTAEQHLEHLAATPDPDARRLAQRLADQEGIPLAAALYHVGAVPLEALVEARAVAHGCPWVRLAHYTPAPEVAALLPLALAEQEEVVALRRRGVVLTAAFLNTREPRASAVADEVPDLAIDPILAVADDPREALVRWYQSRHGQLAPAYQEFGRYLVRRDVLTRAQLDAVWQQVVQERTPLDVALVGRDLLAPGEVAQLLAAYLGLELADLELRQEFRDLVDALGQPQRELVWRDPVNPAVARLLPADVAEQVAALPIQRRAELTVVAMANPLDEPSVQAIQSALRTPILIQVAERRPLEMARRRVWRSASLGERLLQAGLIGPDDLQRALSLHDASGVRIGQALTSVGCVTPEELAFFLAQQFDLPYFDLEGVEPEPDVARLLPPPLESEQRFLPLYRDSDEAIVVATPDPLAPDELGRVAEQLDGATVRQVVVTEPAFAAALDQVFREEFREHSANALLARSPDDSARRVLSRGQKVFFISVLVALAFGFLLAPLFTGTLLVGIATVFYLSFSAYKFYLAYRAIAHTLEIETTQAEIAALDDRALPMYTILVPLYKESEVLPRLVKAIDRLDYPKPKLDVKLLLEEDDEETIAVARASQLPSHFKIVIIPQGKPRGKPKACNYGLIHALGEYVVIFDAEDLPERDQLKKALVAFDKAGASVACVQAKLNYYNRDQNMLTRWFTTEYSMWFDLFLPGLDASGAPIPLGGTSNHFRTDALRELGAWDPYNVTEDADLGVRLYKAGYKTAVIDSTTYEEANSEVYNWIRQRSRWVKGYIQTYLVHMRHPVKLWKQMGPRGFLSFQMTVGGTFFGFLVNPVFWLLTASWFLFQFTWIKQIYPAPLFYIGAFSLYFGNFTFVYLNVAGCLRREYYDMVKYALLSPFYWALMSIAAWKGFLQLFYAPSYWEKTKHGLYKGEINVEPASQLRDLI
jgi:cellulose synthase/poly-beta-1,6-N-acetylglucosamine synthase-like glycosyltransferase